MSISDLRQGTSSSGNVSSPGAVVGAEGWTVEEKKLSLTQINNKQFDVKKVPFSESGVKLSVINGPGELDRGVDYEILGGSGGSRYQDLFNSSLNGSEQLSADSSVTEGFTGRASFFSLENVGDSIFFPFTPASSIDWGFLGFDLGVTPSWNAFPYTSGTNPGRRVVETSSNEWAGFMPNKTSTAAWPDTNMTDWGDQNISGEPMQLVFGGNGKLQFFINGVFIGESVTTIPSSGVRLWLVYNGGLTFPALDAPSGKTISWSGLTLDGLLEVDDIVKVTYFTNKP